MTTKPKLVTRLDEAAMALLDRWFPTETGIDPPDAEKQIKAFDAVTKFYGPRTKLGGNDEDKKESEFDELRNRLNRRKTKNRPRHSVNGSDIDPTDTAGTA